ncbi:MAG: hypothetical protein QG622_1463 [Actinomycetota bacterium]|nr:hypothetical protein [Actinomycetota bacterium]
MYRRVGELWIALGVLHFVVIGALARDDIMGILRDGYVNVIGEDARRNAVFWLFFLGAPMIMLGVALRWIQRRAGTVPEPVSWLALVAFTLGALAVPSSGFWLGILLAVYGILASRRDVSLGGVSCGEPVTPTRAVDPSTATS